MTAAFEERLTAHARRCIDCRQNWPCTERGLLAELSRYRAATQAVLSPSDEDRDEMIRSVAYQLNIGLSVGRAVRATNAVLYELRAAIAAELEVGE